MEFQKPDIVIVPGAFTFASSFACFRDKLRLLEYPTEVLELPSAGSKGLKGLDDDAAALRSVLSRKVEQGKEVVVLAHSYGGVVAANSIQEFILTRRREVGKEGGVILLIYLMGFAIPKGRSLYDMLGGMPPAWHQIEGNIVRPDPSQLSIVALNDLTSEVAARFSSDATDSSSSCFRSPVIYEPWSDSQCFYILAKEDGAVPYPIQQQMASQFGEHTTFELDSGHLAYLSVPDKVVEGVELGIRGVMSRSYL